jgi:predicted DNA binding CopG/RHH family protein
MKRKAVQKMTPEQIKWGLSLSIEERIKFIDNFIKLSHNVKPTKKSKLISIKIPEDLLEMFRMKCESQNLSYQTQIKELMREWVL